MERNQHPLRPSHQSRDLPRFSPPFLSSLARTLPPPARLPTSRSAAAPPSHSIEAHLAAPTFSPLWIQPLGGRYLCSGHGLLLRHDNSIVLRVSGLQGGEGAEVARAWRTAAADPRHLCLATIAIVSSVWFFPGNDEMTGCSGPTADAMGLVTGDQLLEVLEMSFLQCENKEVYHLWFAPQTHVQKPCPVSLAKPTEDCRFDTRTKNDDALIEDIFLGKDSENHDAIFFKERPGMFRLLFSEANCGEEAKPFNVVQQDKCNKGMKLLGNIKEKMENLPTTNSAAHESCKMQEEIRDLWLQFLQCTTLDNGKSLLTLVRSSLWRELKKCMAGNLKAAYEKISADDIESTFSPWNAVDEHTKKKEVSYPTGETAGLSLDQGIGHFRSSNSQGIHLVDIILRTLWCMEDLVDEVIKTEPICSKHDHCGPCVCVIVHNIFSLWEKMEDH